MKKFSAPITQIGPNGEPVKVQVKTTVELWQVGGKPQDDPEETQPPAPITDDDVDRE